MSKNGPNEPNVILLNLFPNSKELSKEDEAQREKMLEQRSVEHIDWPKKIR